MELPIKPDSNVMNLLINAKSLLTHAVSHSLNDTILDRMLTIVGIDHFIEYVLRILNRHLEIETNLDKDFENCDLSTLAGEINKYLKTTFSTNLPYISEIKLIRRTRNLVQHGMSDPNPPDLKRYVYITEKFFEKILSKFFGIEKEQIKISSIIENKDVKDFILYAENYLENHNEQNIIKCIIACRDAFDNQLYIKSRNSMLKLDLLPVLITTKNIWVKWFYKKVYEELFLVTLGCNLEKYKKFISYIDHIPKEYVPEKEWSLNMQRPWEKDDAIFCYNFVSEFIIQCQNQELSPIYISKLDKEYLFKDTFCGVELSNKNEGVVYTGSIHDAMRLFYTDKSLKDKLINLKKDKIYKYVSEQYIDGEYKKTHEARIKIHNVHHEIVTHNPDRWEILVSYTVLK